MGNQWSSSTAVVDKKESSSNENKSEMKPETIIREEKEVCDCVVQNIEQEEIKVEEKESSEDQGEGVHESVIVPSSASVRTLIIFHLCLKKLTRIYFQTMNTRSMIKAPTVCPPGFQPDRFGNCRPVF